MTFRCVLLYLFISATAFGQCLWVYNPFTRKLDCTSNVTTAAGVVALFSGCSGTQYLGADGACHVSGGPPTGAAGGKLGGTYPNPGLNAVCADLTNVAASCSTDTTVATNISTGTLAPARLGVLATPVFVSIGGPLAQGGSSTSIAITAPASITNGNVLLAVVDVAGQSAETWTPPAGFTQIGSTVGFGGSNKKALGVFCKIANNESGTYTFSWNNASSLRVTGSVLNISGATCTPDGTPSTAAANAAAITAASFATATPNDILIAIASQRYSASFTYLSTPGIFTLRGQTQGEFIGTASWGGTSTPAVTAMCATNANTPNVGCTADDFVMMVLALPGSAASTNIPIEQNSAASLSSLTVSESAHVTGKAQADGGFVVKNGCTSNSPTNSFAVELVDGAIASAMCINTSNNLTFDTDQRFPFFSIGGGLHGGPQLLVSSGGIQWPTQDALQDLLITQTDANNNLFIGNATRAGSNQQNDTYYQVQSNKTHRFSVNGVEVGEVNANGIAAVNTTTLAGESLTNPNLTSGTSWTQTGDCALVSNAATCTFSSGTGTLQQASGTLAIAADPNRWYAFTYTISAVTNASNTGVPIASITTALAAVPAYLDLTVGTHTTFVQAGSTPGNFVISTTLVTPQAFTIDTLSLKESLSGGLYAGGPVGGLTYQTATNCSSSTSPSVCGSAAAGSVVVAAAASTVVVNTTAVTANSQIFVMYDSSLGTKLGVTCNTTEPGLYGVTARTAATSFTLSATSPITNPACFSYFIVN